MSDIALTSNDVQFLQALANVAKTNRDEGDKQSMLTSRGLLSEGLLQIFGVERSSSGAWFFNVYVEFEPMFKPSPAKDWQK